MKLDKKTTTKKKKLLILLVIVLILATAGVGVAAYFKVGPFAPKSTINLDKPTEEQKQAGQDAKKNTIDAVDQSQGDNSKPATGGSDPLPAPTPSPTPGGKATVGAEITAANQNGAMLQVRTLIQTVTSSGTCTLNMTGPSGKTYTTTADVQALPSSTSCKGFDIPVSNLAPGNWTINLAFSNATYQASASKTVTIQ